MKKIEMEKYGWIVIWAIGSIVFAFVIHWLFSIEPTVEFFRAKWSAGDILTYASTIILGLLALWQNQRFKEEKTINRKSGWKK